MSAATADATRETRIQALLAELVRERQRLRYGSDRGLLEANRLSIVYWQGELARCRAPRN